jgi:hypothetical protein
VKQCTIKHCQCCAQTDICKHASGALVFYVVEKKQDQDCDQRCMISSKRHEEDVYL